MEESAEEPKKFSWVEKDVLAAMGYPETAGNMKYLKEQGIAILINFQNIPKDEQKYYDEDEVERAEQKQYQVNPKNYGIIVHHMYIDDYGAPTVEQMIKMNDIIETAKKNKIPVGMHCWGGFGRTGTMTASYLIYTRRDTDAAKKESYVNDIIDETRKMRRGSIETPEQEEVLFDYWKHLQK